jgi:hypothetical protein
LRPTRPRCRYRSCRAGTAVTASRLFQHLKILVTTTNDDPETVLEKLQRDEVAAAALAAGNPAPLFLELMGENGLNSLAISLDDRGCAVTGYCC